MLPPFFLRCLRYSFDSGNDLNLTGYTMELFGVILGIVPVFLCLARTIAGCIP